MLVLTQASAGAFLADLAARATGMVVPPALPMLGLALGLAGIAASLLHLGRPLYAYRALIGLRHSWLSREVAAFGLFANLALAHAAAVLWRPELATATAAAVGSAAVAAVGCSVMVYHVVRRPFWHATLSGTRFAGTAVVAGLAAVLVVSAGSRPAALALAAAMWARLASDVLVLSHLRDPRLTPLRRSAVLLCGPLVRGSVVRLVLGLVGGLALPMLLVALGEAVPTVLRVEVAGVAFLAVLGGELAERALFFMAVVRPKMPGGLPS
jgi:DMSO reductase anchor subunit